MLLLLRPQSKEEVANRNGLFLCVFLGIKLGWNINSATNNVDDSLTKSASITMMVCRNLSVGLVDIMLAIKENMTAAKVKKMRFMKPPLCVCTSESPHFYCHHKVLPVHVDAQKFLHQPMAVPHPIQINKLN